MTANPTHDLAVATAEAVLAMARLVQPSEREPFDALHAALIAARASTPEANDPPPWPQEREAAQEWSDEDVRECAARIYAAEFVTSLSQARDDISVISTEQNHHWWPRQRSARAALHLASERMAGLRYDVREIKRERDDLRARLATVEAERDATTKQRNDLKNRWCEAAEECGNLRVRIAASRRPPAARMPGVDELVEIMEREMQRLGGTLDQVSWMRAALYSVARAVHSAASAAQPKEQ